MALWDARGVQSAGTCFGTLRSVDQGTSVFHRVSGAQKFTGIKLPAECGSDNWNFPI